MKVTRYKVYFHDKVIKTKKEGFIVAKTKKDAKSFLALREGRNNVITSLEDWENIVVPDNILVPYIEKVSFVKK